MEDSHHISARTRRIFTTALFVIGTCTGTFMQTGLVACLPQIMLAFDVDASGGQWVTTLYMMVNGIVIPLTGYLMSRFQARHLLSVGMTIFAVGCFGDVFANNYPIFLIFRATQAVGTGIMMPLMQFVLFRLYPPERRGTAMGIAGIAVAGTPVIAPVFTGLVCDLAGWQSVFIILGACALVVLLLGLLLLRNDTEPTKRPLDIISIPLLVVALFGILFGLNSLGSATGDELAVLTPLAIGLVSLAFFIHRQLVKEKPFLNLHTFKCGSFTLGCILIFFVYGAMMSNLIILSLYVEDLRGLSVTTYALVTLPGAIATMVLTPLMGKLLDRQGAFPVILCGLTVLGLGFLAIGTSKGDTPLALVAATYLLRCIGVSCLVQTIPTWAVNKLPSAQIPDGTALVNSMRQIGGSVINIVAILMLSSFSVGFGSFAAVSYTFYVFGACSIIFAGAFALFKARYHAA